MSEFEFQSSLLLLGKGPEDLINFGIESMESSEQVLDALRVHKFKVLFIERGQFSSESDTYQFLRNVTELSDELRIVLFGSQLDPAEVLRLLNSELLHGIHLIDDKTQNLTWRDIVESSLEDFNKASQQRALLTLFDEQNEKLEALKQTLEERVQKRQKYLESSQRRLQRMDHRMRLLQKCFVAIHESQSASQIEEKIRNRLEEDLGITNVEIQRKSDGMIERSPSSNALDISLNNENSEIGKIRFHRGQSKNFLSQEEDLLVQIADSVSLAIQRMDVAAQLATLTGQWETTFDAISDPVFLFDKDAQVLKVNKALEMMVEDPSKRRDAKTLCRSLGFSWEDLNISLQTRQRTETDLNDQHRIFEVDVHVVANPNGDESVFVAIFRDVTEAAIVEKQTMESQKLEDLGVIGSSIAHELNNPLGGILNFLQLILMDLPHTSPHFEDIKAMEESALKCKGIVETLLSFARTEDAESSEPFPLNQVIEKAIALCEIQAKSQGIVLDWSPEELDIELIGHKTQWIQGVRNLLQNSLDAIERRKLKTPDLKGQVKIEVQNIHSSPQLLIKDNGDGISAENMPRIFNPLFSTKPNSTAAGLGLTIAFQILSAHGAQIYFRSVPSSGTTAIISLKSPELAASSQVFDAKI